MSYITWLRSRLGPSLIPLVFATAVIQDEDGRVLFQRRADFGPAWWGLPGGLVEPGETPPQALVREAREETGLQVEPLEFTGVYSSLSYRVVYPNGDQVQQVSLCYRCRIRGGTLRPDGTEVLQLRFFPPDDLPPRPIWYADMLADALPGGPGGQAVPYFEPPESLPAETLYPNLLAVRRTLGSARLVWPGASAVIRDEAGRLLLQERTDLGVWGLPAGALDVGETLARAAVRETFEETGLEVEPVRLAAVSAGHEVVYPNGDRLFPVGFAFECRVTGGRLRPDGHESRAVEFFDPQALPPLLPAMVERVRRVLAGSDPRWVF